MTFTSFFIGIILMGLGFTMLWQTNFWLNNFGDIGHLAGLYNANWASWKVVGIIFMFVGFMIAFGLFQALIKMTVGQLFVFGV